MASRRKDRTSTDRFVEPVAIDADIEPILRARISAKRVIHSMHVASLAQELARCHGVDPDSARRAGLLHDLWREAGAGSVLEARRRGLGRAMEFDEDGSDVLEDWMDGNPVLLHGALAAYEARERFALPQVWCDAIAFHTTGRGGMTIEDMVIQVADHACEGRRGDHVDEWRRTAFEDLGRATLAMIEHLVSNLLEAKAMLWVPTVEARNDLMTRFGPRKRTIA
ncbi:MAG: HD domain-containing protein [Chloroflexi bacterium]|nr:HD domain-containing protein [Chloroflexota bacterium]